MAFLVEMELPINPCVMVGRPSLQGRREADMRVLPMTVLTAAMLVLLPVMGSGVRSVEEAGTASRVTVIHKNLSSPTIEELAQKAGDRSNAGTPEEEPSFESLRKAQWI